MGRDKTTGRGCAQSIVSKPITKKLIAEGIQNKLIFKKARKSKWELFRVIDYGGPYMYVMSDLLDALPDDPLWFPSFIDAEMWARAVEQFQTFKGLDENVEKYLLPEMDEYIQDIPDSELVSITKDFLIEHGVINKPISQRAGKTYYFDKSEIYSLDKTSSLFPYETRIKFHMFEVKGETCFNMNVWRKAVSQFEVGKILEDCIKIFLKTELVHRESQELSPIDRLVQYISPFVYERVPENKNEFTFDRIRVTVGLPRYQFNSWEALRNEVKKYQREIYQRVIQKLQKDRQFKKYGVPISFLKLSEVTLLHDFSIEFIFELKEQKND